MMPGGPRAAYERVKPMLDACLLYTSSLAVQAVLAVAERGGRADRVEDELFRFERLVAATPQLRDVLTDRTVPGAAKAEVVATLLDAKAAPETLRLARQAVLAPRGRRFSAVVEEYLDIASTRRAQLTATVTSAVDLLSLIHI